MMDIREYDGIVAPESLRTEESIWHYLKTASAIDRLRHAHQEEWGIIVDDIEAREHRKTALLCAKHLQTIEHLN